MDGFDGGMYNAVDAGVYGGLCQQLIDRVWARELMCVSPKSLSAIRALYGHAFAAICWETSPSQ